MAEKERDVYYGKLRDIEILIMQNKEGVMSESALIRNIEKLLYY